MVKLSDISASHILCAVDSFGDKDAAVVVAVKLDVQILAGGVCGHLVLLSIAGAKGRRQMSAA